MRRLYLLAVLGVTVSCHLDKLFSGPGDGGGSSKTPPETGTLAVTASTSGPTPGTTNYTVRVDSSSQPIPTSGTATVSGLAAGTHTVELMGVPLTCSVGDPNPRTMAISAGDSKSTTFTVNCVTSLGFTTQPESTLVDSVIKPPVTVTAFDSAGNVVRGFAGVVTLALTNPQGATLHGKNAVAAVQGVATFGDLYVDHAATAYTLTASVGGLTARSDAFDVTAPPPPTGSIAVTTNTTGESLDPDGYTVTVDGTGGSSKPIADQQTVTFSGLSTSDHRVTLTGIAGNCSVSGGGSQTVPVTANQTAPVTFAITCTALTGNLTVTASTTGSSLPTNDYTVTVDGGSSQPIAPNGSPVIFTGLSLTSHTVTLTGVPSNCTVSGGNSLTVTVTASGAQTTFTITCVALPPPTGSIAVTTNTTGESLDPNGYTVTVDGTGGSSKPIADQQTVTFSGLSTSDHRVTLTGIAGNCSVSGGASQTVPVTANQTAPVTFAIVCTALPGSLTVTTSTTGPNPPSGYTFSIDGGASQQIGASQSITVPNQSAGSHSVALSGIPGNCSVSGANPVSVTVPAAGVGLADFTVTCSGSPPPPPPPPPGPYLLFTDQPAITQAGQPMNIVRVTVYTAAGNQDRTYTGPVTLSIGFNPSGGTLTGGGTIVMDLGLGGVVQWEHLSIDKPGFGYTLHATSPGLREAFSDPLDITDGPPPAANGADGLGFFSQPVTVRAGDVLPPLRVGALGPPNGTVITAYTGPVWISLGTNPSGATLTGTRRLMVVNGFVTFSDLKIDKPGSGYILRATAWPLNYTLSRPFDVTP